MKTENRISQWRVSLAGALRSSTLENTLWLGGASIVTGLAGAATSAILARSLGVEEFGVLSLVLTLMVLLSDLSDLGMSNSLIRFGAQSVGEGDIGRLRIVLSTYLRAKVYLGCLVLLAAAVFVRPVVSAVFGHVDDRVIPFFWMSLPAVALSSVAGVFAPLFQSFKKFRLQAILSVIRALAKIGILLGLVGIHFGLSIPIVLVIEMISLGMYILGAYSFAPVRGFSLKLRDEHLAREMFAFNKWISLYQIIALLGGRLDVLLLGGLSNALSLGLYGAASKVATLVVTFSNSYLTVLLPEISAGGSTEGLRKKQQTATVIVVFLAGGILALGALADPVIRVLFGATFADAAPVLRIMSIGLICTVLGYPFNAVLFALNRSVVFPVLSAVSVVVLTVVNYLLIPRFGAEGAAIGFSASSLSALLVSYTFYRVATRKPPGAATVS